MVRKDHFNKEKERDLEFLLDQNDDDADQHQDIEADKYESSSEGDSDDDADGNGRPQAHSFSSQQWPQSYKETTDSYTIAAAPNLESVLRGPSFIYSSFDNRSKSSLDIDGKAPFLSSEGINQSTWWEKASVQRHFSGELPIGYGCSFSQTIFNSTTMLFHCNLVTMPANI